jgi:hypothetical protein
MEFQSTSAEASPVAASDSCGFVVIRWGLDRQCGRLEPRGASPITLSSASLRTVAM